MRILNHISSKAAYCVDFLHNFLIYDFIYTLRSWRRDTLRKGKFENRRFSRAVIQFRYAQH